MEQQTVRVIQDATSLLSVARRQVAHDPASGHRRKLALASSVHRVELITVAVMVTTVATAMVVGSRARDQAGPGVLPVVTVLVALLVAGAVGLRGWATPGRTRRGQRPSQDALALVAHELRAPVAVISGYLSLAVDGSCTLGHAMEVVGVKLGEIEALVDTLAISSKLDADALRPAPETIDVAEAVRAAASRIAPRAQLEGADVEVALPDRSLSARADPSHVSRILDNLLGNALTYSRRPAEVRVEVRLAAGRRGQIRAHNDIPARGAGGCCPSHPIN